MDTRLTVVALADAVHEPMFGGKAASLSLAVRAGLPVPPGAALPAAFVDAVAEGTPSSIAMLLESAHVPDARLAVRSSAIGEDSMGASFAGQHATKLNVRRAQLQSAVRAVWESGRSPAALAYRSRKGLPPEPRIGVVVQMMVEPVAAGVLFTRNPVTGADERMIEAAWGLGEAIVNGSVAPDRFRLDNHGRIVEFTAGDKDIKIWYGDDDGTLELEVPEELRAAPCLTAAKVQELHELAIRCESVWGPDLDIEWALGPDHRIYLLQCRPITTLSAPAQ
jgi:pyruvate, water dikinase